MGDPLVTWRIEFTQEGLRPVASKLAEDLQRGGVATVEPVYKPPHDATLGTPEIIVTIMVTAAAKALIVSGLHAIEHALEKQIDPDVDRRAQIILSGPTTPKRRFPISLQNIGKDALKEFISQIVSVVDQL